MSAARLAIAFLLALAVPLAETGLELELAQGSLAALALAPWIVLAPLPRAPGARPAARMALGTVCFAFPPLALGLGLDLARGCDGPPLALAVASAGTALFLWTLAAERAAGVRRARTFYAAAWLALVPGAAALRLALAWVPLRDGSVPGGRPAWLALDPLIHCHRFGRAGGLAGGLAAEAAWVVLGAGLVLLGVLLLERGAAERGVP